MNRKFMIGFLCLQLMLSIGLAGDLRINILNGTSNLTGSADRVAILDLSAGMVELASQSNVNGSVTFSDIANSGQGQYLIQASLSGVNYSTMFVPTPGVSAWESTITIYDTQNNMDGVNVSVPFFVIYGFEDKLYIQKRTIFENISNPPVTFSDSPGIVKVHVPETVSQMDYMTFKNGTMPVKTGAIPAGEDQVIPNALKPGTTELDMAYYTPYDPAGTKLTEKIGYDIPHFHVYTMPIDLNISLPGLSREGTDNENGLAIYAMENVKAGSLLEFTVSGRGMSESDPDQHEQHQQNSGRIVVETRLPVSIEYGLAGVLIMVVLISLFISITQQSEDLKQESIKMIKDQKNVLLKEYQALGESSTDEAKRDNLLSRLLSVYKTLDRIK